MDDSSKQWITMGPPATPAEERALSDVRKLLPDVNTTCAWVNLTFVAHGGQSSEVDVILLNHNGLFVLELKGWHGRITGDQQNWRVTDPNGQVRTAPNPLHSTTLKAKRLKGLLEQSWNWHRGKLPFIRAVTVMHGRDSRVELDEVAMTDTYGLDGYNVKGLPLLSELLNSPASYSDDIVDTGRAHRIVQAMGKTGFKARPKSLKVGEYELTDADPLGEGSNWVDRRARHPLIKSQFRRVRMYGYPPMATAAQRSAILNAAKREMLFTAGLDHPGIVSPRP